MGATQSTPPPSRPSRSGGYRSSRSRGQTHRRSSSPRIHVPSVRLKHSCGGSTVVPQGCQYFTCRYCGKTLENPRYQLEAEDEDPIAFTRTAILAQHIKEEMKLKMVPEEYEIETQGRRMMRTLKLDRDEHFMLSTMPLPGLSQSLTLSPTLVLG